MLLFSAAPSACQYLSFVYGEPDRIGSHSIHPKIETEEGNCLCCQIGLGDGASNVWEVTD